jgi:hypothetical protein
MNGQFSQIYDAKTSCKLLILSMFLLLCADNIKIWKKKFFVKISDIYYIPVIHCLLWIQTGQNGSKRKILRNLCFVIRVALLFG